MVQDRVAQGEAVQTSSPVGDFVCVTSLDT